MRLLYYDRDALNVRANDRETYMYKIVLYTWMYECVQSYILCFDFCVYINIHYMII